MRRPGFPSNAPVPPVGRADRTSPRRSGGCSCSSASFRGANAGLYLWLRSSQPLRGNHRSASSRPIKHTLIPSLCVWERVCACVCVGLSIRVGQSCNPWLRTSKWNTNWTKLEKRRFQFKDLDEGVKHSLLRLQWCLDLVRNHFAVVFPLSHRTFRSVLVSETHRGFFLLVTSPPGRLLYLLAASYVTTWISSRWVVSSPPLFIFFLLNLDNNSSQDCELPQRPARQPCVIALFHCVGEQVEKMYFFYFTVGRRSFSLPLWVVLCCCAVLNGAKHLYCCMKCAVKQKENEFGQLDLFSWSWILNYFLILDGLNEWEPSRTWIVCSINTLCSRLAWPRCHYSFLWSYSLKSYKSTKIILLNKFRFCHILTNLFCQVVFGPQCLVSACCLKFQWCALSFLMKDINSLGQLASWLQHRPVEMQIIGPKSVSWIL